MEERKGEDANAFLAARHGWLDILRREIKTRPKLVNDLEPGKTKDGGLGLLHLGVLGGYGSNNVALRRTLSNRGFLSLVTPLLYNIFFPYLKT